MSMSFFGRVVPSLTFFVLIAPMCEAQLCGRLGANFKKSCYQRTHCTSRCVTQGTGGSHVYDCWLQYQQDLSLCRKYFSNDPAFCAKCNAMARSRYERCLLGGCLTLGVELGDGDPLVPPISPPVVPPVVPPACPTTPQTCREFYHTCIASGSPEAVCSDLFFACLEQIPSDPTDPTTTNFVGPYATCPPVVYHQPAARCQPVVRCRLIFRRR